jgi:hypothetical protein
MTDIRVTPFERLETTFSPQPWPFAERHRAAIVARFAELQRQNPALWNGNVLLLHEHVLDGPVFRGSYLQTDYASFLVWHDWKNPDAGVWDCFAQGALRAADGAFLLGVMAAHTANAGKIYFPSGTPDPSDVVGDAVDLGASVWREVAEETGLTASELIADPGWHAVFAGPQIAQIKVLRARMDAVALRDRILGFLARERRPELSDIRIVRGPADLDPAMPDFVRAFLSYAWANLP